MQLILNIPIAFKVIVIFLHVNHVKTLTHGVVINNMCNIQLYCQLELYLPRGKVALDLVIITVNQVVMLLTIVINNIITNEAVID